MSPEKLDSSKQYLLEAKKCFKIALIIIAVFLIAVIVLLIVSGGDFSNNGSGVIWWTLAPVVPFVSAVPVLLIFGLINIVWYVRDKKKIK